MTETDWFPITAPIGSHTYEVLVGVVNKGIDARLEAFTKSEFSDFVSEYGLPRFMFNFHPDELSILLRRLNELWDSDSSWADEAGSLADDIVELQYGYETI